MIKNIDINVAGLTCVERNIAPPMRDAVTIPMTVDGRELIVYVCTSPFGDMNSATRATPAHVVELARHLVSRVWGS